MQRLRNLGGASGGIGRRFRLWFGQYRRFDSSTASNLVRLELFAPAPAANPLYIGADGQTVVFLAATSTSAKYLGAKSLF